jgi:hypothetical protein
MLQAGQDIPNIEIFSPLIKALSMLTNFPNDEEVTATEMLESQF